MRHHGDGHVQGPDAGGTVRSGTEYEPANAPSNDVQGDNHSGHRGGSLRVGRRLEFVGSHIFGCSYVHTSKGQSQDEQADSAQK